jgi:hypothetical protein
VPEAVNHPQHYGGEDNPYEHIKVSNAWNLNYELGNATKYICRAGKKGDNALEDLKKARWYIDYEIKKLEEVEVQARAKEFSRLCCVSGCKNPPVFKENDRLFCVMHAPKGCSVTVVMPKIVPVSPAV